jgi:hypothetical protein
MRLFCGTWASAVQAATSRLPRTRVVRRQQMRSSNYLSPSCTATGVPQVNFFLPLLFSALRFRYDSGGISCPCISRCVALQPSSMFTPPFQKPPVCDGFVSRVGQHTLSSPRNKTINVQYTFFAREYNRREILLIVQSSISRPGTNHSHRK